MSVEVIYLLCVHKTTEQTAYNTYYILLCIYDVYVRTLLYSTFPPVSSALKKKKKKCNTYVFSLLPHLYFGGIRPTNLFFVKYSCSISLSFKRL